MREKGRYMHINIPYNGGYGPYTHENWPYVHYEPKYEATTPYGSYRYLFHLSAPPLGSPQPLSLLLPPSHSLKLQSIPYHKMHIFANCVTLLNLHERHRPRELPNSIHLIDFEGVKMPLNSSKKESYSDNHLASGQGQPTFHLRSIDFARLAASSSSSTSASYYGCYYVAPHGGVCRMASR